ncbi:hypothetical protein LCGC14_2373240, partial [marine sediment metagenome]
MKFLIMLVVLLCAPAFAEESDDTLLGRCVAATAVAGNTGAALYILHNMTAAQRRAVKQAPNLDVSNRFGLTGLMFSAINGELELARALFQQGASLNLIDPKEKNTALHFAINNMRSKVSQRVGTYLIDMYANTRLKNKYGQTPLHLTISTDIDSDWIAMVERLIKNGADINAQTNQGDTILHLAVKMKKIV